MPQINPHGKYIFGWALIGAQSDIQIPPETQCEYKFEDGGTAILISGSKASGGFSLGNQLFLGHPRFAALFAMFPFLLSHDRGEGDLFPYKGRSYGWVKIEAGGKVHLSSYTLDVLGLRTGDAFLVIRGSNLAFDYAHRGPLVERAQSHPEIPVFSS
jgi:hypothetical protein